MTLPLWRRNDEICEYFDKGDYLLIEVHASWTAANSERVIDGSLREATKRGHVRLLFDLRKWLTPDSQFTRFLGGSYVAKVLPPPFKVAAYFLPQAINRFGENAARNRGADFRVFPDEQSALCWLIEGSDVRQ